MLKAFASMLAHLPQDQALTRWVDADPAKWAQMRKDAMACFNRRFLIDRSAESFIQAMEIYGLRRHVPNLPGLNQARGTP